MIGLLRILFQLFNLFNVPYILYLGDYQKRTGGYIYDYVKYVYI